MTTCESFVKLLGLSDELLEHILSFCWVDDLCNVMRTCKRLDGLVVGSERIWPAVWLRQCGTMLPDSGPRVKKFHEKPPCRALERFIYHWSHQKNYVRARRAAKRLALNSKEQELRARVHGLQKSLRAELQRQEEIKKTLEEQLKQRHVAIKGWCLPEQESVVRMMTSKTTNTPCREAEVRARTSSHFWHPHAVHEALANVTTQVTLRVCRAALLVGQSFDPWCTPSGNFIPIAMMV